MPVKASLKRIPRLSLHKSTGQGYVGLEGVFHYMGRYDDPATHEKAMRFIAEWIANGYRPRVDPKELAVNELAAACVERARRYYDPNREAWKGCASHCGCILLENCTMHEIESQERPEEWLLDAKSRMRAYIRAARAHATTASLRNR